MELVELQKEADRAGRKAFLFGFVALIFAVMFGYLLSIIGNTGPETHPVVVAATPIDAFVPISADQLKVIAWPIVALPEGTFSTVAEVLSEARLAVTAISPGEAILATRLSSTENGLGIGHLVPEEMRAFVLPISEAVAETKVIKPGTYIDILMTSKDEKSNGQITRVILQNVLVIAVGDKIEVPRAKADSPWTGSSVLTLLLTLADSEVLTLATRSGSLDVVARGPNDAAVQETQGMRTKELLNLGVTLQEDPVADDVKKDKPKKRVYRTAAPVVEQPVMYRIGQ